MNRKQRISALIVLAALVLLLSACAHVPHAATTATAQAAQTAAPAQQGPEREDLIALVKAAQDGNVVETKGLLATGIDVNALDADHKTPLIGAAISGKAEVVRILLEHGAKPDLQEPDTGWSPLHFAAFFNYPDVIEILLSHGADVNARNHFGETPLLQATFRGHDEAVKTLLAHHADVTPKNDKGFTALKAAKYKRFTGIEKALEKAGAKS